MNELVIYSTFLNKIGITSTQELEKMNIKSIDDLSQLKLKDISKLELNKKSIKNLFDFFNDFYYIYSKNNNLKLKSKIINSFLKKISTKNLKINTYNNSSVIPIIIKNCHSPYSNLKNHINNKKANDFSFNFGKKTRGAKKSKSRIYNKCILKYNRKILVSFGISDYVEWEDLMNPKNDVKALTNFAEKKLGFSHIYAYTDKVTKRMMEKIITNDLYKIANEDDLVVMSFHGHGHTLTFNSRDEGFLVPFDCPSTPTPFNLISMRDLSKWFQYIKSRHILILLDCCFSGLSVLRNKQTLNHKDLNIKAIVTNLKSSSKIVINAGTYTESVSDGGWGENSIFTGSIISCPIFDNTVGSALNLYYYLLQTIPRYSNQTPSIGKLQGDMGTDIFLSL